MPWYYAIAERDHEIQNPTSEEKIRLLGERLRLTPEAHVLDVACGKAGPAVILAREFGCRITGIERAPEFAFVARERVSAAGLDDLIEIVERDASEVELERRHYDVAMCLGASFVWATLQGTLGALLQTVRAHGRVVVGETFWRRWPLPAGVDHEGFVSLGGTATRFEDAGLTVETMIVSSNDDWDRYETLHWHALEEWLRENPGDPDAGEVRTRHERNRDEYLQWRRELFGWAIFAGRKDDRGS